MRSILPAGRTAALGAAGRLEPSCSRTDGCDGRSGTLRVLFDMTQWTPREAGQRRRRRGLLGSVGARVAFGTLVSTTGLSTLAVALLMGSCMSRLRAAGRPPTPRSLTTRPALSSCLQRCGLAFNSLRTMRLSSIAPTVMNMQYRSDHGTFM